MAQNLRPLWPLSLLSGHHCAANPLSFLCRWMEFHSNGANCRVIDLGIEKPHNVTSLEKMTHLDPTASDSGLFLVPGVPVEPLTPIAQLQPTHPQLTVPAEPWALLGSLCQAAAYYSVFFFFLDNFPQWKSINIYKSGENSLMNSVTPVFSRDAHLSSLVSPTPTLCSASCWAPR